MCDLAGDEARMAGDLRCRLAAVWVEGGLREGAPEEVDDEATEEMAPRVGGRLEGAPKGGVTRYVGAFTDTVNAMAEEARFRSLWRG